MRKRETQVDEGFSGYLTDKSYEWVLRTKKRSILAKQDVLLS